MHSLKRVNISSHIPIGKEIISMIQTLIQVAKEQSYHVTKTHPQQNNKVRESKLKLVPEYLSSAKANLTTPCRHLQAIAASSRLELTSKLNLIIPNDDYKNQEITQFTKF